jgi:hypothetical protein
VKEGTRERIKIMSKKIPKRDKFEPNLRRKKKIVEQKILCGTIDWKDTEALKSYAEEMKASEIALAEEGIEDYRKSLEEIDKED